MTNVVIVPPGLQIRLAGAHMNAPLAVTDWADFFGEGQSNTIYFDIANRRDVLLRVQRDITGRTLSAELWNADGTGYEAQHLAIERVETKPLSGEGELGGPNTSCSLAYLHWASNLVPPSNVFPRSEDTDLGNWEFEGNLESKPPIPLGEEGSRKARFAGTATYPPFITQGEPRVLRAGAPEKLSAAGSRSLSDHRPLSYEWSEVSGPTQLQWTGQTTATPAIDGLKFGTYKIRLKVTDAAGQSATSVVEYGAVRTGPHDVVVNDDPRVATILGPLLRLGAGPWPYFDRRNRGMADFFGRLQGKEYLDTWNTALPGVITVRKGSTTVTGQGTSFRAAFCSGGKPSATLIVWYPVAHGSGRTGRHPYQIAFCRNDTELQLAHPYTQSEGGDGWKYSRMDDNAIGTWINGSSNANYYDNVLAFYSLYYRSGLEQYRQYARTLADRWWTMPWIDEGRAASGGDGATYLFPRLKSLTGLILRALDGRPEMWPGIRVLIESDRSLWLLHRDMTDMREEAYATAWQALGALADPDSAYRAKFKGQLLQALNTHWTPNHLPNGGWKNISFGYASWNGSPGTATVKHGSTAVTGQGTHWEAERFKDNAFWTANQDFSHGDKTSYTVHSVSPTALELDRPYEGESATNRAWQASNLVGYGTEPFLLGLVASAFRYAYAATDDPRPRQWIIDIANWLTREGIRPSTGGLWYARGFPNCEPIRDGNPWCGPGSVDESRALAGTVASAFASAYRYGENAATRAVGDRLFGAMYGKDGGPDADAHYVSEIDAGGWDEQVKRAKDFGFFFGWGFGGAWPAARLGSAEK